MPLDLNDPRWQELNSSYGDVSDVVAWLSEACAEGGLSDERRGDLINEIQHQDGTCTAMYAVALHFVALARDGDDLSALQLLTDAGLIYASAGRPDAVPCPAFLRDEFIQTAPGAARALSELLPQALEFDRFKYGVAALAGFLGHDKFARFLDGLDLHEGRFYHTLLGGAFPEQR